MTPSRSDSIRTYYEMQVTTASTRKTICFVHEQCAQLLHQALSEENEKQHSFTEKAQNLLALLERSLRLDDPTSESLFLLYDYCYCQLEVVVPERINNVLSVVSTLRNTFDELLFSC